MKNSQISYLITCSTERQTLKNLLHRLTEYLKTGDEIVVVFDTDTSDKDYKNFILSLIPVNLRDVTKILGHSLNKNYGEHKNWGTQQTSNPWIFQLDGDELPQETLLLNIHEIIESNPNVDLIYVPRINDFIGVTPQHALQWGWRLSPCEDIIHEKTIDTNSSEYHFLKKNGYIIEEIKI